MNCSETHISTVYMLRVAAKTATESCFSDAGMRDAREIASKPEVPLGRWQLVV